MIQLHTYRDMCAKAIVEKFDNSSKKKRLLQTIFRELLDAYPRFAGIERMKSERPVVTTVWNVISGVKHVLATTGISVEASVAEMTRQKLDLYQKFGAEKASSISGDDIKTVTRYYADPAQPNIGNVRVVDLL